MNPTLKTNLGYFTAPAVEFWMNTPHYKRGTPIAIAREYRFKNVAVATMGPTSIWAGAQFKVLNEAVSRPTVAVDFIVYYSRHYDGKDLTAFDSAPAVVAVNLECSTMSEAYDLVQTLDTMDVADLLGELIDLTRCFPYSLGDRLDADPARSLSLRLDGRLAPCAPSLHVSTWGVFPFRD